MSWVSLSDSIFFGWVSRRSQGILVCIYHIVSYKVLVYAMMVQSGTFIFLQLDSRSFMCKGSRKGIVHHMTCHMQDPGGWRSTINLSSLNAVQCRSVSVTICETDIFANNVSTHLQGLSSCTLPYGTLAIDWTTVLQYSSAAVASFALPASNVLLGATY